MDFSFAILAVAALLAAAAAVWVLRAYRRGGTDQTKPLPAMALAGLAAVSALGLYLALGRPDLPDAPFRARLEALKQRDPTSLTGDEALAILSERARLEPREAAPHFYSGQILLSTDRPAEAARAFDAALRRDPNDAEAMMGLGRAFVQIDGHVSPRALAVFEALSEALPHDPAPILYRAQAALEAGQDARPLWGEALARMAPDDPRRPMAERMRTMAPEVAP